MIINRLDQKETIMKKLLKLLGILIALIVVVILIAAFTINMRGIPSYDTQKVEFTASGSDEAIARGTKLVKTLCAGCHMDNSTGLLTGKQMLDAPAEFGKIYSPNITQDKTHGIGNWTDGELVYLLRTGIKRDGQYSPPWMAKLPHLADSDMDAIISFLKTDDEIVRANPTPDKACEPSFLSKFLCAVAFKPLPYSEKKIELPNPNDELALGKYLAYNLECFSCHSADFKTNNFLEPSLSVGFFGGGNQTLNMEREVVPTSNLTPDKGTGIGNWSKEKFIKAVKTGLLEGEMALRYPMVPYAYMSDEEIGAIYTYLMSIPAISNKIERPEV